MAKRIFAIGCHPDDIEFMMSGTLMNFKDADWEVHYMNLANGSCGTDSVSTEEIISIRRKEAINAARYIGATYHESLANDIEVFYNKELLAKLTSVIRDVKPNIILTHSYNEYMEDHSNTCRLVVTAAFCRGMKNFPVIPHFETTLQDIAIYHAMPYGLSDIYGNRVYAKSYVDVSKQMNKKAEMLAIHKSQKEWLDFSQGMDSYILQMKKLSSQMGVLSQKYKYAEGWTAHSHLGLANSTLAVDIMDNII